MRVVIAPDSLKESLSAEDAAVCIGKGIIGVLPDANLIYCPLADGGEGMTRTLVNATHGRICKAIVHDPLMRGMESFYGVLGDGEIAVIEVAAASGLELLSRAERNPLVTTSFGTGELIAAALDKGYRKFIIGLGGSAVNDAGAGILSALGATFLNKEGDGFIPAGGQLGEVSKIDLTTFDPRIQDSLFLVACDVSNPLKGENGASVVFGPQKGATPQMVKLLDQNMVHFSRRIKESTGTDVELIAGAGAAGGIGAIMVSVFKAHMKKGFDVVSELLSLEEKVSKCDLVITAEGKTDMQTLSGKAPLGVCLLAKKYKKPVLVFCGIKGEGAERLLESGASAIISISSESISPEDSIRNAAQYLQNAVASSIQHWRDYGRFS